MSSEGMTGGSSAPKRTCAVVGLVQFFVGCSIEGLNSSLIVGWRPLQFLAT